MNHRTLSFITLVILAFFSCNPSLRHAKRQFFRMSTMVDVTVSSNKNDATLERLWRSVDSLLAFWESRYSQTTGRSEVRTFNSLAGSVRPVTGLFGGMIADALAYGDTTGGLFDITILPIKNLWGLGETDTIHRVPGADTLARTLRHVDYRSVRVNRSHDTVFLADTAATIDAGGFAKGYALMDVAALLDKKGFTDYLVSAGDVVARGRRCDGKPWRIGIQDPRKERLIASVAFDTGAIFTSGDYESFWMLGDRRIHHLFNPGTGRSCTNNRSVTIGSPSVLQAKYLSTGLFCLPADSVVAFVDRRGINCLVVDSTGAVFISKGWKNRVTIE